MAIASHKAKQYRHFEDIFNPATSMYLHGDLIIGTVTITICIIRIFTVLAKFVSDVRAIIVQNGHENQKSILTYTIINHHTIS